ncbi:CAX-interacting protein 4 [Linum grandiflorum]
MPATAGRVRMPANNRVHSSAALQTHGIWQSAIGYDPYAPNKDDSKPDNAASSSSDGENAYNSFQGLLALARITGGSNATDEVRGCCKRCGRVGHLSYQCRNFLSTKENIKNDVDPAGVQALSGLKRVKGKGDEESEEDDEESESSDSDVDPEIERIIAERLGKTKSGSRKKNKKKKEEDSDEEDKRGRSRKRRRKEESSEAEDEKRQRKEKKRRKRDERKSRKAKRRRRSHRYSDDSDTDRKSKKKAAGSSDSDDSRVGRKTKKAEKRSRRGE